MKPRVLFRIVAAILLFTGGALVNATLHDRSPRDSWREVAGPLVTIDWTEHQRTGLRCQLTLGGEGAQRRFVVDHVRQADAAVQPRLEALRPGAALVVSVIPRGDTGQEPSTDEPLPVLALRAGGELLFDSERDAPGGAWIVWSARIVGGVVMLVALGMLTLTRRPAVT